MLSLERGIMTNAFPFPGVVSVAQLQGDSEEDTKSLSRMHGNAKKFVSRHRWCGAIVDEYFGFGVGGIIAIFLFRIAPNTAAAEPFVWVIVGDMPPMYLSAAVYPDPDAAMDGYVELTRRWAEAAIQQSPLPPHLPPMNVPFTREFGEALRSRLDFIEKEILLPRKLA